MGFVTTEGGLDKLCRFKIQQLYIYFACMSVRLSVRLYPINVKTAEPIGPTFCEGSALQA